MSEFNIIATQIPGKVNFENFEEIRDALLKKIAVYKNMVYSEDDIAAIQRSLDELKEDREVVSKIQKELKAAYTKPFEDVNEKLEELKSIIDEPYRPMKAFLDEIEKNDKKEAILSFAAEEAKKLGNYSEKVITSPAFFKKEWLLKSCTVKKYQDEIRGIVEQSANDLNSIQASGGENTSALLAHYFESLSMDSVKKFRETLREAEISSDALDGLDEDNVLGYKILKITATESQMASLMDQLELMGLDVEEIEDGMPKAMEELTDPDFDSFVAFDIETTGSFGAASGDGEAKITEIGAVKVVNGTVVDRFDELANPGRKIVPRIARITHITDEMLADKPSIDEVMRRFAEFCGDSILVGHNIKSSDLHYIGKAAKKAGVKMENSFFDTYIFAKRLQKQEHFEELNLGYLSGIYEIEHKDKHRAWSDAEANAEVYFKLKESC